MTLLNSCFCVKVQKHNNLDPPYKPMFTAFAFSAIASFTILLTARSVYYSKLPGRLIVINKNL